MRTNLITALVLALTGSALQAEEAPRPWSNVSTLSFVATGGNSQGQTLGMGNEYQYKWTQSALALKAGAIRANSTVVSRSATGQSLEDYQVLESRVKNTTAETYFANGRYDHRLKDQDRWYWYGGAGWERNRPAGLENKYAATGGFGRIWFDSEGSKFRTDAGFGYTHEQPMVKPTGFNADYGTFNFTAQLRQQIGANSQYAMDLELTDNLKETKDYQGVLRQGLTVSLNKTLALKVGLDLIYRNLPKSFPVRVVSSLNPGQELGLVPFEAKKLDTLFTTSLVITF